MFCPLCGTGMPDEAQFCPACGADAKAEAGGAATDSQPTTPLPVAPAPVQPSPTPPVYAPAPTAAIPVAAPQYAPPPQGVPAAPPKKKSGLVIAIVVIVILLLCGGGVAAALFVPAIRAMMPWASQPETPPTPSPSTQPPPAVATTQEDAAIKAAGKVVNDFYAGINAGDLAAVTALVTEDTKSAIDPGAFEGWMTTTFEYTRGWIEGDVAYVIGRENPQAAYGAGENGGVKFTLRRTGEAWLIDGWQSVDTAQVEGSDTTGSSTGVAGPLSDASARDVMTQILDARKVGAGNIVRRLGSERFLRENGDAWLDGIDNSEFFSYSITTVTLSGSTAEVVVSESWPDGTTPTVYGLVEQSGAVLVDSWKP